MGRKLAPETKEIEAFLRSLQAALRPIADAHSQLPSSPSLYHEAIEERFALLGWQKQHAVEVLELLEDEFVTRLPLATLPLGYTFPVSSRGQVTYDIQGQFLSFRGLMTIEQKNDLEQGVSDTAFLEAISGLYYEPRDLLVRRLAYAEHPEFSVALTTMPSITLSDSLKDKVHYDTVHRVLRFVGVMKRTERDELLGLSTDLPYQMAIQELYNKVLPYFVSTNTLTMPSIVIPSWMAQKLRFDTATNTLRITGVMRPYERDTLLALSRQSDYVAAVEDLFQQGRLAPVPPFYSLSDVDVLVTESIEIRLQKVLSSLFPHIRTKQSRPIVSKHVSTALLIPQAQAEIIVSMLPSGSHPVRPIVDDFYPLSFSQRSANAPFDEASLVEQFAGYRTLSRFASVINALHLKTTTVSWFVEHCMNATWFNPSSGSFEMEDCMAIARLQTSLPGGVHALASVIHSTWGQNATTLKIRNALEKSVKWSLQDTQVIESMFTWSLSDYQNIHVIERLQNIFSILDKMEISAQILSDWQSRDVTPVIAHGIKQSVRAKYSKKEWKKIAVTIQDKLREQQRDALVAALLATPKQNASLQPLWTDIESLYDYLLVDPMMSACMLTSRMKQAISCVQLFGQRCVLGLETKVHADKQLDDAWEEWSWRKKYRVWEANRKVFLYPENWIEPELRSNKSPFFTELEQELLQDDLTPEVATSALTHYLEKLDQIAHLEIVATLHQTEAQPTRELLHIFGRTQATPHIYYYTQRSEDGRWRPWERIDIEIEGEHLVPAIWNQRLVLFWSKFSENVDRSQININQAKKPKANWKIDVFWSEYRNGRWSAPKQASKSIIRKGEEGPNSDRYDKGSYIFQSDVSQQDLVFWYTHTAFFNSYQQNDAPYKVDALRVFPHGKVTPHKRVAPSLVEMRKRHFYETFHMGNRFRSMHSPYVPLTVHDGEKGEHVRLLQTATQSTPDTFQVTLDGQSFFYNPAPVVEGIGFEQPLVYEDSRAAFLITPEVSISRRAYVDPQHNAVAVQVERNVEGYTLSTLFHPWTDLFLRVLQSEGLSGVYQRALQQRPETYPYTKLLDFVNTYQPTSNVLAQDDTGRSLYPEERVSFNLEEAYASYNWEFFFHVPLLIAERLRQNQRFAEAQKWFHAIFNPVDASAQPSPARFWQTKVFYDEASGSQQSSQVPTSIQGILQQLAQGHASKALERHIKSWQRHPFQPHIIAQMRTSAYMKNVLMKYIDNLLDWGDHLFRQDSIESINEASQLYILASSLLGPTRETLPARNQAQTQTYNTLRGSLGRFSNAVVELEHLIPSVANEFKHGNVESHILQSRTRSFVPSIPKLMYFCISPNQKLEEYRTKVSDRLFKIRHCMNLEGRVRQLSLFSPPIDPALLVQAAAAGVDIGDALSDMNAAMAPYRFVFLLSKAQALCAEARQLGDKLLASLEKRDAEALSQLRSKQEHKILDAYKQVRQRQADDAKLALEGLQKTREITELRRAYYQEKKKIDSYEQLHMSDLKASHEASQLAQRIQIGISTLHAFPNVDIGIAGFASSPMVKASWGGSNLGSAAQAVAKRFQFLAAMHSHNASMASVRGGYERRWEEWRHQEDVLTEELAQMDKQIAGARLRYEIAKQEIKQHKRQIAHAKEIIDFMQDKYTNESLYGWMVGQVSKLYFQTYQLAYEMAKRAERAYQFEVESSERFVQFGHWDSLKKGLFSGEYLSHDLNQMEIRYLEQHKRTYELTKRISLSSLSPTALLELKQKGSCWIELPEVLFDLDHPGHFQRRIKMVNLTIPCVTGPYSQVNATLTLHKHSIRHTQMSTGAYTRQSKKDTRFTDGYGAVSIATSRGQEDSGMFEPNIRDERYLHFEGSGVISRWHLALPDSYRQFDYESISDVILTIMYTAREGGEALKQQAIASIEKSINAIAHNTQESGMLRYISLKQEAGTALHQFLTTTPILLDGDETIAHSTTIEIDRKHFPFLFDNKTIEIKQTTLILTLKDAYRSSYDDGSPLTLRLARAATGLGQSVSLKTAQSVPNLPAGTIVESPQTPLNSPEVWRIWAKNVDFGAAGFPTALVDGEQLKTEAIEDIGLLINYVIS